VVIGAVDWASNSLSLQSLRYEQMWTLLIALVLLSGGTDLSAMLRRRGCSSRLTERPTLQPQQMPLSRRDPVVNLSLLGAVVLLLFSFWSKPISPNSGHPEPLNCWQE